MTPFPERVDACTLTIPGRVAGKGRPRARVVDGHARIYTPADTVKAEDRCRDAWRAIGSPWLGDGALFAHVTFHEQRPLGHWKVNGELSAAGLRAPFPCRKPDGDNAYKTLTDALCGCLYRDDVQIVDGRFSKRWLPARDLPEYAVLEVWTPLESRDHWLEVVAA